MKKRSPQSAHVDADDGTAHGLPHFIRPDDPATPDESSTTAPPPRPSAGRSASISAARTPSVSLPHTPHPSNSDTASPNAIPRLSAASSTTRQHSRSGSGNHPPSSTQALPLTAKDDERLWVAAPAPPESAVARGIPSDRLPPTMRQRRLGGSGSTGDSPLIHSEQGAATKGGAATPGATTTPPAQSPQSTAAAVSPSLSTTPASGAGGGHERHVSFANNNDSNGSTATSTGDDDSGLAGKPPHDGGDTSTTTGGSAERQPQPTARLQQYARAIFLAPLQLPRGGTPSSPAMGTPSAPRSTLTTASPMHVDPSVLEVPLRDDITVTSRRKGTVHYVRQTRTTTGRCTFDTAFLTLRLNDEVVFQWFDAAHHVYETNRSYEKVVPGGRSSTTQTAGNRTDIIVPEHVDGEAGAMVFRTRFTAPGDYYFVCSKNKRRMRLHVQVVSDSARWMSCGLLTLIGLIVIAAVITIVVVILADWLQRKDLFLSRADAVSEAQYDATQELQKLVTNNLFPWLATGILIVLVVIVLAIVVPIVRCCLPKRQGSWHRGVKASTRRIFGVGTVTCCLATVVLLFVTYGLQLNVTDGVNNFAQQLGGSVSATLNAYSGALYKIDWLATEGPVMFPNITFPTDDVTRVVGEVSNILNDTMRWTQFGEDLAQGAFRLLPIVLFLTLQLGLFASAMAVGAVVLRYRRPTRAVAWILAVCIGIYACAVGVSWAESRLIVELYDSAVVFRDGPQAGAHLKNGSLAEQLFASCTFTDTDVQFVSEYVADILREVNSTLSPEQQESFTTVFGFFMDVTPVTLEALVNYTSYIQANLDNVMAILVNDGDAVNAAAGLEVVPFLEVLVSAVQTLSGLVNCYIIQEILANALPLLKHNVQSYNTALMVILFIIFALSVPTLWLAIGSAYSLEYPRKTWHEPRTGRWFRLRYSYKVHHSILMRTETPKVTSAKWFTALQTAAHPFMQRFLDLRLVCYSASTLLFFNAILLVLFNDVAHTIADAPLLRAVSYMGCAQLILLLAAALFRHMIIRLVVRTLSLLVVAACLVVAFVQAVIGYVKFGQCVGDVRFSSSAVLGASPYYETCPVTYVGHELEVAVYGTVVAVNSLVLMITLILLIAHERHVNATTRRRPYVGVFSPFERMWSSLACLFKDALYVKRVYTSIFIFIVIVFLVLMSVVDTSRFHLIGTNLHPSATYGSTIVQVLDPDVACNGNRRFCDLRVNQYMWACAHNAHSSMEDGFVAANHYYNISHQLYAGIRSFMIDLWYDKINGTISDEVDVYLCHTVCLAGRRPFRQVAREYSQFLRDHPAQIIMIILEQYVNNSDVGKIIDEEGLSPFVWYSDQEPPHRNPNYVWPTMQEMINKNQRLMMFTDVRAVSNLADHTPEWLYYAYDYQFENQYQTSSPSDWRCGVGRGWCTLGLEDVNKTDTDDSSESFESSSSSASSSDGNTSPEKGPEYWVKWWADVTNCTDEPGPWRNGSDVYNIYRHGGNPPLVASKLSTVNHMMTRGTGSPVLAAQANVPASIEIAGLNCSTYWNQVVNIFAFDYWTIANPLATIHRMNLNLVKYGKKYNYSDAWGMMLFGTDKTIAELANEESA